MSSQSCNLSWYIVEFHPTVIHECTPSSTSTHDYLLQYLNRLALCFIKRHDTIIYESWESDYLFLCIANPIVSSRTLKIVEHNSQTNNIDEYTRIGMALLMSLVTLITVGRDEIHCNTLTWLTKLPIYFKTLQERALFQWTHENLASC